MKAAFLSTVLFSLLFSATPARSADCPIRDIDLNASVTATLATTDCHYRDIIQSARSDSNIHVYRINVATRGVLTVGMSSSAFDPSLYLFTTALESLTSNDNISRANLNSEIVVSLKPGTYILLASSKTTSQSGDYTLKTSFEISPSCAITDIPTATEITSELTNEDCRILDLWAPSDDTSRVKLYRVTVPQTGVLNVSLQSAAFEPYLSLLDAKRNEVTYAYPDLTADALMTYSSNPGTYLLLATAYDYGIGAFTMTVKLEDLRVCTPKPLDIGATLSGELTEEACRFLDLVVPSDDVSLVDLYSLTVIDPALVTLTMKSQDFDAYLAVLDKDQNDIAEDDDSGGGPDGTDAKIATSLNPGTYTVLANTADYGAGVYTVAAASEALRSCPGQDLAPGGSASGSLKSDSCRILDIIIPSDNRTLVDRYNVALADRSVLNLEATSSDAPVGIGIYDGKSELVNSASGAGAKPAASLALLLKPDKYTALVTLAGSTLGSYTLNSGSQPPKDCPVEEFSLGAIGGSLSDSSCVLKDMLMGSLRTWPAKQYRVQITDPGTLKLAISSPDSIVEVILVDSNDQIVDYNYGDTEAGEIEVAVKAGTYTILVALYDGTTGTYSLNADYQLVRSTIVGGS